MNMKYVMLSAQIDDQTVKLVPILFPEFMSHVDVAEAFVFILSNSHRMAATVDSAGDISIDNNIECSGDSVTLNVSSNPKRDERIIRSYNHLHGIDWL